MFEDFPRAIIEAHEIKKQATPAQTTAHVAPTTARENVEIDPEEGSLLPWKKQT